MNDSKVGAVVVAFGLPSIHRRSNSVYRSRIGARGTSTDDSVLYMNVTHTLQRFC